MADAGTPTPVLVVCDVDGDRLVRDLESLGAAVTMVSSPGEALYLLEDPAAPFVMAIVEIDREEPDRLQLLAYLRDNRPLLRRVLLVGDAGGIVVDEDCTVIERAERLEMLAVLFGR